jgi:YegS/Rv2252/BmrU family lipid kinase
MIAIVNPEAAGGRAGRRWLRVQAALERRYGPVGVRETRGPGDAELFVRQAAEAGVPRIAVAGGDGTLNEAVNGLAAPGIGALRDHRPEIVYLPVGSGGDFARMTGYGGTGLEEGIASAAPRAIDLGRLAVRGPDGADRVRLFANIASAGLSADIAGRANRAGKRLGGAVAFRAATIAGLLAWRDAPVRLRVDGAAVAEEALSIAAIANGRWFGSGMCIAPEARLDSGAFEVVVVRGASVALFLRHGGKLRRGEHTHLPQFSRFSGRVVEIEPLDPATPLPVEADGEHPGDAPCRAEILPGAATIVAPW